MSGDVEAGEERLRAWVEEDPGAIGARLNLAAVLLGEEQAEEALGLLNIVPPDSPRDRQSWALQRSVALLHLGRSDEATALLADLGPVTPELEPLRLWRDIVFAARRGDQQAARAAAAEMEQSLDQTAHVMLPEHAIMARFDLARFWTKQREPQRTFQHWSKGHALLSRYQPFSREAYEDFVDASIEAFDYDRLHHGPKASNTDDSPVFIVGMPRSGTTLTEQILDAHSDAHGAGERPALGRTFAQLGGENETAEAARRVAGVGARGARPSLSLLFA